MGALRWLWARPWFRFGATPVLALLLLAVESSNRARSAVRQALRDPYALLSGRSPGGRDPGALFQTKLAYAPARRALAGPHQRVLPAERVRPPSGGGAPGFGDTPLGIPASTLGPLGDSLPSFGGGGGSPPLIGDTVPPFIGGGAAPANGASLNPTPVSSVPSAVPEPETWGLLLLGVGAIGLGSRRRRAARRRDRAATASRAARKQR